MSRFDFVRKAIGIRTFVEQKKTDGPAGPVRNPKYRIMRNSTDTDIY